MILSDPDDFRTIYAKKSRFFRFNHQLPRAGDRSRSECENHVFSATSRPSRRRVITRRRVVCIPAECEDGPPSSRVCLACFVSFVYFFAAIRRMNSCGGEHCAPPRPPSAWWIPFAPTPAGGGDRHWPPPIPRFNFSIFHIFRERCRKS